MNQGDQLEKSQQIAKVVAKLKKSIEAGVKKAMCNEIPVLTATEYLNRIAASKQLFDGRLIEENLGMIASKLVESYQDVNAPDVLNFKLGEINSRHMFILRRIVSELVEYKTLQQIRSNLDIYDLADGLIPLLQTAVQNSSNTKLECVIIDLEAELAMCLTDSERKDSLEVEYRNRLAAFKQRAQESILSECIGGHYIPVRWFTGDNLADVISFIIWDVVVTTKESNDIRFDLRVIRNSCYDNGIIQETTEMLAEWRIIEWLKGELRPNVTPSTALDEVESVSQSESKKENLPPILSIAHEIRQNVYDALAPYIDEDNLLNLSTLIIEHKMPSSKINYHCPQSSLAYLFRELLMSDKNLVRSTQIGAAEWLCFHFIPTTYDTIYDVIRGKKTPKNNRIEIKL